MVDTVENIRLLKLMVRGSYDLQSLRMQAGLRLCANFRAKLKTDAPEPVEGEEVQEDELSKEALDVIDNLKKSYRRLTDGIAKNRTLPLEKDFVGDELISTYTEAVLVEQYLQLEKQETRQFSQLVSTLEQIPIYTDYLVHQRGIGPALAAVLITYFDPHKARHVSSFWKFCFPAGTLVTTPNGMRAIETLKAGEVVIDADGFLTTIKDTMVRTFTGNMVTIESIGTLPLTLSDDHPVKIVRGDTTRWMHAKDVQNGDKLIVPDMDYQKESVMQFDATAKAVGRQPKLGMPMTITPDIAYLLGVFVGDGSASVWHEGIYRRGIIQVAFAKDEVVEAENYRSSVEATFGSAMLVETETGHSVRWGRGTVSSKFQEWFGHGAHNKKLPDFIMGLSDPECVKSFLRGYFDTDGYVVKDGKSSGTITASSASNGLLLQIQSLLGKIGVFGTLHHQVRKEGSIGYIRGRQFNQRVDRYVLSVPKSDASSVYSDLLPEMNRVARKVERDEGRWLLTVKRVLCSPVVDTQVFNLHTVSNTYLAQNIAVHNCGLDVGPDGAGRSRRAEHLVLRDYTDKNGKAATRLSTTYNPWLKMKLLGAMGPSFLRSNSPWREQFDNYKHRIISDPNREKVTLVEWKKRFAAIKKLESEEEIIEAEIALKKIWAPGRIKNAALRFMVKMFLADFWATWRKMEGLEVSEPYAVGKLGMRPHGSDGPVTRDEAAE